ncbi:MAG: dienelactone hydrolase family protein [Acidovorax sp.]|uniref:dienelactone hydrolase family protein n=1 Tax=Acidovorax sp. TaxID=1872122 RepID=UPI0022C574C2|nr:dienelactone hydrolase family protein [Acidovorax sp.]MCZ8221518.1 dienelactone hydrolase family protein [Acidovorax sp.]
MGLVSRFLLCVATAFTAVTVHAAPALLRVDLPPLPSGVVLHAHWLPAEGAERRPAVLALHGCGGLYAKGGGLAERYRETAERLHAAGYAVLMPDSFGSRGLRDICQTRYRDRSVDVAQRVQDARAALAWLAAQPQVDVRRIGVLGWSNGATTTLNLLEQRLARPELGEPAIAGAAVFYPGCGPLAKRQSVLEAAPLLMLLGALDDWTPAQPCVDFARSLQARSGGGDITVHVYDNSYHGFDGTAPVRLRADVPNGTSPQGVHQGGNPEARAKSLAALDVFWSRVLATRAAP